jgi:nucleoside-diphosphate-sugar epimerase
MRIVVTGASGGIGRYVVADLLAHGHEVHAVDRVPAPDVLDELIAAAAAEVAEEAASAKTTPPAAGHVSWSQGEARDPEFIASVMDAARPDALIHLAALPTPLHGTPLEVFGTNVEATFVALEAAGNAGVKRVSLASSISLLGLPYGAKGLAPLYAPVDEAHPNIGTDPYALSKEVDEATAHMMQRRHGYQVVALRISNTAPMAAHLARLEHAEEDPGDLANELWAYLDVRDGARAFALAVEREIPGCTVINVMAPDTYSPLPSAELMARFHPSTPLRRPLVGREVPFDVTRCHEILGFEPKYLLPLPR